VLALQGTLSHFNPHPDVFSPKYEFHLEELETFRRKDIEALKNKRLRRQWRGRRMRRGRRGKRVWPKGQMRMSVLPLNLYQQHRAS